MNNIPLHVAIIMDGNGRWAEAHGKTRTSGHEAGVNALEKIIKKADGSGIKYLSLFAFSAENWARPAGEVKTLMRLLSKALDAYFKKLPAENVRLVVSGRREPLPENILEKIDKITAHTARNTGLTVNLALNYGGQQEITDAVNKMISSGVKKIKDGDIAAYLYHPEIPEPELIIRTSGEERLSNFLMWQSAYSEFYFTPVLWPDFNEAEFEKALKDYASRNRRFGKV